MSARFLSCLAVALVCLGANCARADDFSGRCMELSRQVKVSVVFEDRAVVTDESRSIQALNGLSGKRTGGRHNVYGLTHAEPYFRLSVAARAVADGRG